MGVAFAAQLSGGSRAKTACSTTVSESSVRRVSEGIHSMPHFVFVSGAVDSGASGVVVIASSVTPACDLHADLSSAVGCMPLFESCTTYQTNASHSFVILVSRVRMQVPLLEILLLPAIKPTPFLFAALNLAHPAALAADGGRSRTTKNKCVAAATKGRAQVSAYSMPKP